LNRKPVEDFEFGFKEPERASRGRITLRSALKLIGDHQTDPKEWTANKLAEVYTLKEETVSEWLEITRKF
jgi:NADH dehydrogenase [ubiquinone] 1 alpha subcomplex assembly factor 4